MNVMTMTSMFLGGLCAAALVRCCLPPRVSVARRVRPYLSSLDAVSAGASQPGVAAFADAGATAMQRTNRSTTWSVLGGPLRALATALARRVESRNDDALERAMVQAGRVDTSPADFRLAQFGTAVANGAILGLAAMLVTHTMATTLVAGICGFVAGAARVRGRLEREIVARTQRMDLELYTINQLLALHVRSGAGPMQAVQRIVHRCNGAVVDELAAVLGWVRNGQREADAFRRAAELTPCAAAGRTYMMFALASERGADLGAALLSVGDDLRDARRDALRKHAVKQRAAMLAPTIGVLAPIMLLFVAAPLPSIVLGGR